jgi:hypothetical protein
MVDMYDSEYTALIYRSPKIKINQDLSINHNIIAIDDASTGELLLAEHVIDGSASMLHYIVGYNKKINNNLCPRNLDGLQNEKSASDKTEKNCFHRVGDTYSLGIVISKINYGCNPNCVVSFEQMDFTYQVPFVIAKIYAIKSIKKDNELTVSYSPYMGHDTRNTDFKCGCDLSLEKRQQIWNICHIISNKFEKECKILTTKFIERYVATPEAKRIVFLHYLASHVGIMFEDSNTPLYVQSKRIGEYEKKDPKVLQKMLDECWSLFCVQYGENTKVDVKEVIGKRFIY